VASVVAMAGCRNFLINEWEAEDDPLYQEVTQGRYPVQRAGRVTLPDGAGLGLEFDAAAFAKRFPYRGGARKMF
jgi:L-alanine-DL-glutamate epimerase-like enolase superfamily enzyme